MVTGRWRSFCEIASTATQLTTLISVIMSVWRPKIKIDRISGGRRQATTVHMIFSTDSPLFIWGDTETVSNESPFTGEALMFSSFSMALPLIGIYFFALILAKRINCTNGRFAGQV
jgi:hypothetical protein